MNALQQFKQKGRILRKYLAQLMGADIKLTQAYEAIAVMEGATNWNQFSAQLAQSAALPLTPLSGQETSAVLDTHLHQPQNAELLRKVCQTTWEHAVEDWKQFIKQGRCEFILESSHIFNALSEHNIVSTGEDGYGDTVEKTVEDALHQLGYSRLARLLYEGRANLQEPLQAIAPFSSLETGDEFVEPESRNRYRKTGVHRAIECGEASTTASLQEKYFSTDFNAEIYKRAPARGPEAKPFKPDVVVQVTLPDGVSASANRLSILEVNLGDVLADYDTPDDVEEWLWVEKHHSFAHRGNGVDGGVWEFMVRTDKLDDTVPPRLKPFFMLAKHSMSTWILFHQG